MKLATHSLILKGCKSDEIRELRLKPNKKKKKKKKKNSMEGKQKETLSANR